MDVHICWMIRRYMPEVLAIESDVYEFPWAEEDFIRCLRQRNCIGMVAEVEENVVGYMIYELHRSRLDLLNLAVRRDCWREGVGSALIAKLAQKLSPQRRQKLCFDVSEANLAGQLFLRAVGFKATAVVAGRYSTLDDGDCDVDAYRFELRCESTVTA